jgi:hypothetical protein
MHVKENNHIMVKVILFDWEGYKERKHYKLVPKTLGKSIPTPA